MIAIPTQSSTQYYLHFSPVRVQPALLHSRKLTNKRKPTEREAEQIAATNAHLLAATAPSQKEQKRRRKARRVAARRIKESHQDPEENDNDSDWILHTTVLDSCVRVVYWKCYNYSVYKSIWLYMICSSNKYILFPTYFQIILVT